MVVHCPDCGIDYDDLYRLTSCTHPAFEMRCRVVVKGEERVATSVEQLDAWIEEDRAWRRAVDPPLTRAQWDKLAALPPLTSVIQGPVHVTPGSLTPTYVNRLQTIAAWWDNWMATAALPLSAASKAGDVA